MTTNNKKDNTMKKLLSILSIALLATSAFAFYGTDDFNDNSMDSDKWFAASSGLTETGGRLEYSKGTGFASWGWDQNEGSYLQDWSVEIDVYSALSPSGWTDQAVMFGLDLQGPNPPADRFELWFEIGNETGFGDYRSVFAQAGNDGDSEVEFAMGSNNSVKLGLSFNAATKLVSAAYDIGSGYVGLTTFDASDWNWTAELDTFSLYVNGSSDVSISSGDIYGDNFAAVPEPATALLMGITGLGLLIKKRLSWRR